jgi:membrane-bound lytic murein transglycosylase A
MTISIPRAAPMSAPTVTMVPCAFSDIPGWLQDDHAAALAAFAASAGAVVERPSTPVGLAAACRAAQALGHAIGDRTKARAFFETHFRPHTVVGGPPGLLTGYYEPVLDGSRVPDDRFTMPVYRRPPDLENVVSEAERGAKPAGLTHVRRTAAGVEPYATRAEIEQGALAGQGLELVYLADPVDAFFLHVQGSGAIRLPGGRFMRITYDGKNGHPYTSVGKAMIADGLFAADELTLQVMGDYLRADPERARPLLWRNESFIFFRPLEGDSPVGVLGTPLHPGRSLAVDTAFHALGTPVFVSSPAMAHVSPVGLNRLMVAHDVGSAITGPERGDVFFGTGEAALALAGVTKHPGRFYILQPVGGS